MNRNYIHTCIKDIAERMKNNKEHGGVSVMIGAGFSKNAINRNSSNDIIPDWSELAVKMYEELYPKDEDISEKDLKEWEERKIVKISGKNVTKLAEEYENTFDRAKLNYLIEKSLNNDFLVPGKLHERLLSYNWQDVFTTNYDTLLEETRKSSGIYNKYQVVYSKDDLPGKTRPRIIKLHGSIPQVKPYIITDEDYRLYPITHAAMVNTVQQTMLENRLCLIGFSGDDPNFQNWLGWIRDNMKDNFSKVYLIGSFYKLSEAEKKLLENKKISLIDLSVLLDNDNKNNQEKGLTEFFNLLDKYQKKETLLDLLPYKNDISKFNFYKNLSNKEKDLNDINLYLDKVIKEKDKFIIIPKDNDYLHYFNKHFSVIMNFLKDSESSNDVNFKLLVIISKIIKILDLYSSYINFHSIKLINKYVDRLIKYNKKNITVSLYNYLFDIDIYLLKYYRIFGSQDEYNEIETRVAGYENNLINKKNDIYFEKIQNALLYFNYDDACKYLDLLDNCSLKEKLKKVSLLTQVSKNDHAKNLLNECLKDLSDLKVSNDIYASYLGYINLCARFFMFFMNNNNIYSDEVCINNEYNTRALIIDEEKKIKDLIIKKHREKIKNDITTYNLNSSYKTISIIGDFTLEEKTFSYLLRINDLCLLPFQSDKNIITELINFDIFSDNEQFWTISYLLKSNDNKILDEILSRDNIINLGKEKINLIFDNIINISKLFNGKSQQNEKYILNLNSIIDSLSRFCVFLDDSKIIDYIKFLSLVSNNEDIINVDENINKALRRICTMFNKNLGNQIQNIIFKEFNTKFTISSYFTKIDIDEINLDEYYNIAINECKSNEKQIKVGGVAKVILLWNSKKVEKYEQEIASAIWANNNNELPNMNFNLQPLWFNLPYLKSTNFEQLYYNYLCKSKITNNNIVDLINKYYHLSCLNLNNILKINNDHFLRINILNNLIEYINNFKNKNETIITNEFLEMEIYCKQCIEFTTLIYYLSFDENDINPDILSKICEIKGLLKDIVNIESIKMIEDLKNERYIECFNRFIEVIFTCYTENYSSVFIGLDCLIFECEKKNYLWPKIKSSFEYFMDYLKYVNINGAKTFWLHFSLIIKRKIFYSKELQEVIFKAMNNCYNNYYDNAVKGHRYYLDGLYNLIKTLKVYYDNLFDNKIEIIQELNDFINITRDIEILEIKNIWNE